MVCSQTAEIITLLYESTLHPLNPEAPALNPTGGVKSKQPLGGLVFLKDPTRPGGGVFIARDSANQEEFKHLEGIVIHEGSEGETLASSYDSQRPNAMAWTPEGQSSPQSPQQHTHAHQAQSNPSMVNYAPLVGANYPNVNPAMNNGFTQVQQQSSNSNNATGAIPPGHVQVINLLDQAQGAGALEQLAMAEAGFLEGMPSTIFDWGTRALDLVLPLLRRC